MQQNTERIWELTHAKNWRENFGQNPYLATVALMQQVAGGVAKGQKGRPGQVPWRRDRAIMQRIRLVMRPSVLNQPVPIVAQMVNSWLQERGLTTVDERTIRRDIDRALELHQERIVGGAEWYRAQFQALYADVWMSIDATPRGKDRAPLYADAIRVLEDMARIDGVWTQSVTGELAAPMVDGDMVDAQSLYEQGQIGEEELRAYLLVLHRETGGIGAPRPAGGDGQVIDGQATEVEPPSRPRPSALPAARNGHGPKNGAIPGVGPMGDELQMDMDVVDWAPDDDE